MIYTYVSQCLGINSYPASHAAMQYKCPSHGPLNRVDSECGSLWGGGEGKVGGNII